MTNAELILALISETVKEIRIETNLPDIEHKGKSITYVMSLSYNSKVRVSMNAGYMYQDYTAEEAYRLLEILTSGIFTAEAVVVKKEAEDDPLAEFEDIEVTEEVS